MDSYIERNQVVGRRWDRRCQKLRGAQDGIGCVALVKENGVNEAPFLTFPCQENKITGEGEVMDLGPDGKVLTSCRVDSDVRRPLSAEALCYFCGAGSDPSERGLIRSQPRTRTAGLISQQKPL